MAINGMILTIFFRCCCCCCKAHNRKMICVFRVVNRCRAAHFIFALAIEIGCYRILYSSNNLRICMVAKGKQIPKALIQRRNFKAINVCECVSVDRNWYQNIGGAERSLNTKIEQNRIHRWNNIGFAETILMTKARFVHNVHTLENESIINIAYFIKISLLSYFCDFVYFYCEPYIYWIEYRL